MKPRTLLGFIVGGALVGVPMALMAIFSIPKNLPSDFGAKYTDLVQRAWSRFKPGRKR